MSGLEIIYDKQEDPVPIYVIKDRLCLTEDDKLVPEGDPEARWLYAIPGDEIPLADAKRYGLVKAGKEPVEEKPPPPPPATPPAKPAKPPKAAKKGPAAKRQSRRQKKS